MMSAFGGAEGMEGLMAQPKDEGRRGGRRPHRHLPLPQPALRRRKRPHRGAAPRPEKSSGSTKGDRPPKRKFLENYCISLTKRAQEGKLDRLIGRDRELERVIQILNRRQKNNPCLIGEPGVGKTAIAEGLAAPHRPGRRPLQAVGQGGLPAGPHRSGGRHQFRGQFESRMKGLIEEIRKLGNIILVIDEVHNIVGAGDARGL